MSGKAGGFPAARQARRTFPANFIVRVGIAPVKWFLGVRATQVRVGQGRCGRGWDAPDPIHPFNHYIQIPAPALRISPCFGGKRIVSSGFSVPLSVGICRIWEARAPCARGVHGRRGGFGGHHDTDVGDDRAGRSIRCRIHRTSRRDTRVRVVQARGVLKFDVSAGGSGKSLIRGAEGVVIRSPLREDPGHLK